jgi:hypothetical protein
MVVVMTVMVSVESRRKKKTGVEGERERWGGTYLYTQLHPYFHTIPPYNLHHDSLTLTILLVVLLVVAGRSLSVGANQETAKAENRD